MQIKLLRPSRTQWNYWDFPTLKCYIYLIYYNVIRYFKAWIISNLTPICHNSSVQSWLKYCTHLCDTTNIAKMIKHYYYCHTQLNYINNDLIRFSCLSAVIVRSGIANGRPVLTHAGRVSIGSDKMLMPTRSAFSLGCSPKINIHAGSPFFFFIHKRKRKT